MAAARGGAGDGGRGDIELGRTIGESVGGQLVRAAAETVGQDDVRPGGDVAFRDRSHVGGMRYVPEFRAFAGRQAALVKEGAPRTIGNEGLSAAQRCKEGFHREFGLKAPGGKTRNVEHPPVSTNQRKVQTIDLR